MKLIKVISLFICILLFTPVYGQTQSIKKSTKFNSPIESVFWLPDGNTYVSTNGNSLQFWDNSTDEITSTKEDSEAQIIATTLSPDGTSLVTIYDDNSFIVQDIATEKYFTKQQGLSDVQILDAVFIDDYYTLLLPMDGKNIYNFFCLLLTNEAVFNQDIQSESYVYGLDVDKDCKNLLVTYSDGNIKLINLETKEIIHETKSHALVSISSQFTPDGKGYIYQLDENTVNVQLIEENTSFSITDFDKPINTASFTPNGKSLALGDKNGFVKVYNVAKGFVEDALKLDDGDIAFSCEFSPDGKTLLVGTKNGNVIKWQPKFTPEVKVITKTEQILVPKELVVTQDPVKEAPKVPKFIKRAEIKDHNILIGAGFGTINSKNFMGNIKAEIGYLNYKLYPLYWGTTLGIDVGITSKSFPYHYRVGNKDIGKPLLLGFAPGILGGFHYMFDKTKIMVFAELTIGANIRMLTSSCLEFPYIGTPAASFFSEIALGAQWKMLRAECNLQLDTNFVYAVSCSIGAVFGLPSKNNK